jgi:hypothetical protein
MNLIKTFKTWVQKVYADVDTNFFPQAADMTGQPNARPTYTPPWDSPPEGSAAQGSWPSKDPGRGGQGLTPETHQDVRGSMTPQPQHNQPQGNDGAAFRVLSNHLGGSDRAFPNAAIHVNKAEVHPSRIAGLCRQLGIEHRNR